MEKLNWVVENWERIGLVLSLIALALAGKWGLIKARVADLLVETAEGPINRAFRKQVRSAAAKAPALVRDAIANLAAKADPKTDRKPESRGKRILKFLGHSALSLILKR